MRAVWLRAVSMFVLVGACALACAFAFALSGCASPTLAPSNAADSPTGGVGLRLWFAQVPTRQYQYFKVAADGTFEYGGGMVAFNRKTDWTGKLTPEQGKSVRAIINEAQWLTVAKPGRKDGETPVAEVRVEADGGYKEFEVNGPDPHVQALVTLLQSVADQRFDQYLQRLPEPGLQKK